MKPSDLYSLYMLEVKGKKKLNHLSITPILNDMQENDNALYQQFLKLLQTYKEHLEVRAEELRQQKLPFDFDNEPNDNNNEELCSATSTQTSLFYAD